MYFIYLLFTVTTFSSLLVDALFYPTFSFRHFGVDSVMMLLCYTILSFLFQKKLPVLPKKLKLIHQKIFFPVLLVSSFILLIVEHLNSPNFVFTHFHIHPFLFLYIPIFNAIIIFSPRLKMENNFIFLLFIPLLFLLGIYVVSLYFPSTFLNLIQEDGILEYTQFLFYFIASLLSFFTATKFRGKKGKSWFFYIFLLLGIALFFIAGEEISWGQRLFGFSTPEKVKDINVQSEFTIHNLKFIHYFLPIAYLIMALYGAVSRFVMEKLGKDYKKIQIFTPPPVLFPLFFIISLFYYESIFGLYTFTSVVNISSVIFPQSWIEVIETCLAFGFFGYTYYTFMSIYSSYSKKF